jgi:hypothetical protein
MVVCADCRANVSYEAQINCRPVRTRYTASALATALVPRVPKAFLAALLLLFYYLLYTRVSQPLESNRQLERGGREKGYTLRQLTSA